MAEPNQHRGDIALTLGERAFVLRPSWEAIAEFETATRAGCVALARRAAGLDLTLGEMAAICAAGIRASGDKAANAKTLREMIFDAGIIEVMPAVTSFLTECLSGGSKTGEAGAAEAR